MVDASSIGWGSYKNYEGPFYKGKNKYILPANPSSSQKTLAVITATEGGAYDAFNGYDRCGWSSGLIQFCEAGYFSLSNLLGAVHDEDRELLTPMHYLLEEGGLGFARDNRGRYRFQDREGYIDTRAEQNKLFYLDGDGTKGAWNPVSRIYAKRWAAGISSIWENPHAQAIQERYIVSRLGGYAYGNAKAVVAEAPDTNEGRAFVAAYLSFAINNPTIAERSLERALNSIYYGQKIYSISWLVQVLGFLTFDPDIVIYPHRYDAIAPVLMGLYGVDIPANHTDLLGTFSEPPEPLAPPSPEPLSTMALQRALTTLGYDLGPYGVDGRFGPKTRDALMSFERVNGHSSPDGLPDTRTSVLLDDALEVAGKHGLRECVCKCSCGYGSGSLS